MARASAHASQFSLLPVEQAPLQDRGPAAVRHGEWPSAAGPAVLPHLPDRSIEWVRSKLSGTLAHKLSSGAELIRALANEPRPDPLPTSVPGLDTLLNGGLDRGALTELTGRRSTGRLSTAIASLSSVTSRGEAVALIDLGDHFDPALATTAGADLARLLWIRPGNLKQAVMAAEMVIATGFQLVVLELGLPPLRGGRLSDAVWVRLARAAEAHGTALLVSSPYPVSGTAAEALLAGSRGRSRWRGSGRAPRLLDGFDTELAIEKRKHHRPGARVGVRFTTVEAMRAGARGEGRGAGVGRTSRTEQRAPSRDASMGDEDPGKRDESASARPSPLTPGL